MSAARPDAELLRQAASAFIEAGHSVLPVKRKEKAPLGPWKEHQTRPATLQEFAIGLQRGADAIALVCGAVSGNMEMLDFDLKGELFEAWAELVKRDAPGLYERLVIERSQSGGFHILYRCPGHTIPGNMKLAMRGIEAPDENEIEVDGKGLKPRRYGDTFFAVVVLIETRGEGGYFLCAPSPGYELKQGRIGQLPAITPEERETMIAAARSLNEWVAPVDVQGTGRSLPAGDDGKPGEAFNQRGEVRALLQRHGWTPCGTRGDNEHWRRPGKDRGISASLMAGRVFYVFSSNGAPFEPDRAYSPFAVLAALEHQGDFKAAARQLGKEGFGTSARMPKAAPKPAVASGGASGASAHLEMARTCVASFGAGNVIFTLGDFWQWDGSGVWRKIEAQAVKRVAHSLYPDKIKSAHTVSSILELAKTEAFMDGESFTPPDEGRIINCRSGVLRWAGKIWELRPHRKEDFATSQIPVAYDPAATAPRFEQFLDEIFAGDEDAEDKKILICEILAYSLLTSCEFEKFILLIGAGANGKSVLLNLLGKLAGRENVCAVQPSQFENKFQRAHLHGKLVNIVSELAEGAEIADAQLKAIASAELITAEHKLKPPFSFRPYSTCWFGTNHLPHTRDFSQALFRRAIVVTFNRVFSDQEQDHRLIEKLAAELPGVLNLALEGMAGVFERGTFTAPASSDRVRQEWRVQADQVAQFAEDCCRFEPDLAITSKAIFERYQEWALEAGIVRRLNRGNFQNRMIRLGAVGHRGAKGARMLLGVGVGQ